MKVIISLIFFFSLSSSVLFATHNRAGTIEYTSLGGLSYEVTIITYTKISGQSAQADRNQLDLNWGDGSMLETIWRTNYTLIAPDVQKNVYTGTHNYPSIGSYLISVKDPNRNDNIININNGASINIPFYLEAKLLIANLNSTNNSVQYLAPPILEAEVGIPFRYNVSGFDPDGDVLIYDLVTPKEEVGQVVPNYFIPDTATVDFLSGEFTWITPQTVGLYVFTIRVQEYRNNVLIGTTIVDYQLNVIPQISNFQWGGNTTWLVDSLGDYSYTLQPNSPIQLNLSYADNGTSVSLEAFSETLNSNHTATQTNHPISSTKDSIDYQWTPSTSEVRCAPYILTFRAYSNYTGRLNRDLTVKIFVRDQTSSNCDTLLNQLSVPIQKISKEVITIATATSPNPFQEECLFQVQSEKVVEEAQLSIFNSLGTQIASHQFYGNNYTYNNANLAPGLYIYTIELLDGRIGSGKIIKL
jgi:hypothetical protein